MSELYQLKHYQWSVPKECIAAYPAKVRGESRLMVVNRATGTIEHQKFADFTNYLNSGDLLIANNSRVLNSRIEIQSENGKLLEAILIPDSETRWLILAKNIRLNSAYKLGPFTLKPIEKLPDGSVAIGMDSKSTVVMQYLSDHGKMPLPTYILKKRQGEEWQGDRERYQTSYARIDSSHGSIAAPTAGLHFTKPQIADLRRRGILWEEITLQVGRATFQPIQSADIRNHRMGKEWYQIPESVILAMKSARQQKKKLIAVGTTVVRTLESYQQSGKTEGMTDLFIYPGYSITQGDALLTNFHLPGSTLLLLVVAFAGEELMREAYAKAVERRYNFYSYGDAMLIL